MTDVQAHAEIGALAARCDILAARVAALTAFACALMETHPKRDELSTRWANNLGPALESLATLNDDGIQFGATIPAWVDHPLSGKPGSHMPRADK